MLDDDKLADLLMKRDALLQQGHEGMPEEVCDDCPELLEEYKVRLESLKRTDWLFDTCDCEDDPARSSGHVESLPRIDLPASSLTIEQFLQAITASGLMDRDELDAFQQGVSGDAASDTRSFARELIQHKKLTPYQASVLLAERRDPLLLDRYIILDTIDRGGMGLVLKALHRAMDRVVALKILPPSILASEERIARFKREIKAAAMLSHPNIVTTHDAHESNGVHFLVMEYVNGKDLRKTVKLHGPLPVATAMNCLLQAARGLEHAHAQGIIHRDIKPGNLLLDADGTTKVSDFGLARLKTPEGGMATTELTLEGVLGTAAYMAPEQAGHSHTADARSDIYSLGCTLYFLLTGKPPFKEETFVATILAHRDKPIPALSDGRDDVPECVIAVYRRMMDKTPENRYQSMTEVVAALCDCDVAQTDPVDQGTFRERKRLAAVEETEIYRQLPSRMWWWTAGAALLLAGAMVSGVLLKQRVENDGPSIVGNTGIVEAMTATGTHASRAGNAAHGGETSQSGAAGSVDRSVAQWVLDIGGSVGVLIDGVETQVGDPVKLPRDAFQLVSINLFENERVSDEDLVDLAQLRDLRALKLEECNITDAGVEHIKDLQSLTSLMLTETEITDEALKHIANLRNLTQLRCGAEKVTDTGIIYLHGLQLRNLSLDWSRITSAGVRHIADSFPDIVDLNIGATLIDDDAMADVGRMKNLRTLWLYRTGISDAALSHLHGLTELTMVCVYKTAVTETGLAELLRTIPDCVIEGGGRIFTLDGWKASSLKDAGVGTKKVNDLTAALPNSKAEPPPPPDPAAWSAILPNDAPPPAIAPFDAATAKKHQEEWAEYLGVPVEQEIEIGGGVKMTMVLMPPGEFLMGLTAEEQARFLKVAESERDLYAIDRTAKNGPQHRVRITKPFRISRCEVTRGQFRQFVEEAGYKTDAEQDGKGGRDTHFTQDPRVIWNTAPGFPQTDQHPVVNVSWNDAREFCRWLSKKQQVKYDLPTDAQWEYACRAGTTTAWHCGDEETTLKEYAWFRGNADLTTYPAGLLKSNAWRLCDMHGNAQEWCADWWIAHNCAQSPRNDPISADNGWARVLRGGSYCHYCWTADRNSNAPDYRNCNIGFRLASVVEHKDAESTTRVQETKAEAEPAVESGSGL